MPDISTLLEQGSKKKFKKSSYRPWNYLEEIEKEEGREEPITKSESKELDNDSEKKQADNFDKIVIPHEELCIVSTSLTPEKSVEIKPQSKKNQSSFERNSNRLDEILRLSGHQKKIFTFILEKCLSRGALSSGIVTSSTLTYITNTTITMVNTSVQRLVDKNLVFRENGKRGRGGFYCFGISQEVRDATVEYRRLSELDKENSIRLEESQVETYSSAIDGRKHQALLPEEWEEINIDSLRHINFSRAHLIQLYKQGHLNHQLIQDSINHFAFDLEKNNKEKEIRTSPINYFMGIIRKEGIYNAPSNYESPREKALREYQAKKRQEEERLKELLGDEYREYRNKKIKEIYDSFPEDLKTKLNEAFEKGTSGVGVVLFKQEGLDNSIALTDFSEFVSAHQTGLFKDVPNFMKFCDMKLKHVS